MEQSTPQTKQPASRDSRRRSGPRHPPGTEMRISTKFAPRKPTDDKPLSCITETTLKPEQMLELYRYLKLTRLVEERLVNLAKQTKVVGGVFRSLGQEATAVGSAYALEPKDFITPLIRDLGAVLVKGIRPREVFAQYMAKAWGPSGGRDLEYSLRRHGKRLYRPNLASRRHDPSDDWRICSPPACKRRRRSRLRTSVTAA